MHRDHTKEVLVEDNSWCDYVFDENYQRMSFEEKEVFLHKEKHLPFIASGKQINETGLPIKETLTGITRNVEEMSLDIIGLYKMIQELKKENDELNAQIRAINNK